jgi:hypothetical protein
VDSSLYQELPRSAAQVFAVSPVLGASKRNGDRRPTLTDPKLLRSLTSGGLSENATVVPEVRTSHFFLHKFFVSFRLGYSDHSEPDPGGVRELRAGKIGATTMPRTTAAILRASLASERRKNRRMRELLDELREQVAQNRRDLDLQFTRLAQLQADIDRLKARSPDQ